MEQQKGEVGANSTEIGINLFASIGNDNGKNQKVRKAWGLSDSFKNSEIQMAINS